MVVPQHRDRPLRRFRAGNLAEGLDRGSRDPQCHRTEAGDDAGKRWNAITVLRQDMWIGKSGSIVDRDEHVPHYHIMAAGATQPTNGPRVDDLARRGGEDHEPGFGRSSSHEVWLPVFTDDAKKNHPGTEFASAYHRPPAIHPVSAGDDLRLPRRARAVRRNDTGVSVYGSRSLRR